MVLIPGPFEKKIKKNRSDTKGFEKSNEKYLIDAEEKKQVERSAVTDITTRITQLEWDYARHIARIKDNRWNTRLLRWRPWAGKRRRSAGLP